MSEIRERPSSRSQPSRTDGATPTVWLLLGDRHGDNAQVLALGRALARDLGWGHEIKRIRYQSDCAVNYRDRGASLVGVDLARSDPLSPPWPDVVIAIGRRPAPVSRWLKRQTGGRLLNVHLGRPRCAYAHFDLIVTTPQYGLPAAPNAIMLSLPIILHDPAKLDSEARDWGPRLGHLPRPWTAVFVGGPTSQLRFDREVAADLLGRARHHADGRGTLLMTTSPRTAPEVATMLATELAEHHFFHRFAADAPNPYQALLRLADDFIVTNDSVSMVAEAGDMAKPLYLFELPMREKHHGMNLFQSLRHDFRRRREMRLIAGAVPDLADRLYDALTRSGHARPRRSVVAFDRRLYDSGLARPLPGVGETLVRGAWSPPRVVTRERDLVVERIRACFAAKRDIRA